jgi:hypothetical protein
MKIAHMTRVSMPSGNLELMRDVILSSSNEDQDFAEIARSTGMEPDGSYDEREAIRFFGVTMSYFMP